MKTATVPCGLLTAIVVLVSGPAAAQRVQFPTPVSQENQPASSANLAQSGQAGGAWSATPYPAQPYTGQPAAPTYPSPSPGPMVPAAPSGSTYASPAAPPGYPPPAYQPPSYPPPAVAPGYPPPAAAPVYSAPTAPPVAAGPVYGSPAPPAAAFAPPYGSPPPAAALQGPVGQPPPPQWDPYGTPGSSCPSPLLPQDPCVPYGPPGGFSPGFNVVTMQKFLRRVGVDYVWMPGNSASEFGINDVDLSATFAIPFLYNTQTPLLVTPGFATHFWSGPVTTLANPADLPPQVYDAYLDTAWNPQPTPWFGAELSFRIGVYSDFDRVVASSIRYTGTGLAVLTFSPSFKIKAGIMYLDRNQVKLLPSGGLVWTPNPDARFEILFPNPKISRRFATIGTTDWWWYVRGEYGGGAWTVRRAHIPGIPPDLNAAGEIDFMDYNDIRIGVGLEFIRLGGLTGFFEAGGAFDREITYRSLSPAVFRPSSTVFLHAGLAY